MNNQVCVLIFILFLQLNRVSAQDNQPYVYPKEPEVLNTLKEWEDCNFGMFIHWGTYSQWGIVESWSLLPLHEEWLYNIRPDSLSYFEYLQAYEDLKKTFNPVNFDPNKWAQAAKYAGMKYVVFTTKHHDGFNMFDTKFSSYKITDKECPFSENEKANVSKEVFEAFRNEGFKTGAYYSVPDWHSNDFWWDKFPPMGKSINYPAEKFPEKIQHYNNFVNNQLNELTSGEYGKLDLLWFDLCYTFPQLQWERIEKTIRTNLPGALLVARHTNTIYENYRTPEQTVPDTTYNYPWEACITMGTSWSYKPHDNYKSTKKILDILIQIVSRGGNLLLNIGPDSKGEIPEEAYQRMKEIGDWMQINGEGIYGTNAVAPYREGKFRFTKKGEYVYAYYELDNNGASVPLSVSIPSFLPVFGSKVFLLGCQKNLNWEQDGNGVIIYIPKGIEKKLLGDSFLCFKMKIDKKHSFVKKTF